MVGVRDFSAVRYIVNINGKLEAIPLCGIVILNDLTYRSTFEKPIMLL